jgi:hypothetical protein
MQRIHGRGSGDLAQAKARSIGVGFGAEPVGDVVVAIAFRNISPLLCCKVEALGIDLVSERDAEQVAIDPTDARLYFAVMAKFDEDQRANRGR